jgi:hypothetical protein
MKPFQKLNLILLLAGTGTASIIVSPIRHWNGETHVLVEIHVDREFKMKEPVTRGGRL